MSEFWIWFETGLQHIADYNGYDHMLFLLVLCAPFTWAQKTKLFWLVSFFTIGHSISLGLAVLGWFKPHVALIEFLIPLSIFLTAIYNLIAPINKQEMSMPGKYAITLFFGIIHGLGFSFLLSSLLGPGKGIIFPLFSFNLGLEIGQLLIVAALILIAQLWQMLLPKKENIRVQLFSIMGAVFSFWLMYTRFLNLYNS